MGVVKYTGPVASFHCPTNAEIRSLKVHFSPKQEGTGDPSPENVRPIVGWDGVVVHNDIEYIPISTEYQRVEYIYNTGNTEWIDTGIIPNTNTKAQIKVMNLYITGDVIFGYYNNDDRTDWRVFNYNQKFYFDCPDNSVPTASGRRFTGTPDWKQDSIYELELGNWYAKDLITNTNLFEGTAREIQGTNTITLNCYQTTNSIKCSNNRWYYVKIYDSNSLVRDMYPCRRKSDDKPGMYDTVTQTFFTNQGTGEFICGPDVGETVEYEFGVLGKNKFNAFNTVYAVGKGTAVYPNGENGVNVSPNETGASVIATSTSAAGMVRIGRVVAGVQYTLSLVRSSNFQIWAELYDIDSINEQMSQSGHKLEVFANGLRQDAFTFTPSYTGYLWCGFGTGTEYSITNIQLELGSTATTYEPYDPKNTVYGGWVDLISGEVCEEYAILTATQNGDITSVDDLGDNCYRIIINFKSNVKANGWNAKGYCDKYTHSINTLPKTSADVNKFYFYYVLNDQAWKIAVAVHSDTPLTNAEEAKNYLESNNFKLIYELFAPINTYHLAPTQLQTFLGQNNVWSNADYVEVEYDLHETQEILNRKSFIMANQPHLVAPEAAQLQSFTTDLAAPLKECRVYFNPVQDLHGYDKPWVGGSGINKLEDEFESGYWNPTTGNPSAGVNYERSKNYNPCLADTEYYCTISGAVTCVILFYDAEYSLISVINGVSKESFTTPTNAAYFKMYFNKEAVNRGVNYPSTETSYIPYSNICPISGWTGCEVYRTGKNMLPAVADSITKSGVTYAIEKDSNGSITSIHVTGTSTGNSSLNTIADDLILPPGNYTLTAMTDGDGQHDFNLRKKGTSTDIVQRVSPKTFSISETTAYKSAYVYCKNGNTFDFYVYPMIRLSSIIDDTFEPYSGTTLPINWTNEAGTIYGGYVDLVTGEVWKTHHKITLDGVTTYCKVNSDYSDSTYIIGGVVYLEPPGISDNYSNSLLFCDTMPILGANKTATALPYIRTTRAGNQYLRIYLANIEDHPELDTKQKRIDFVNAYLAENPVTVVYPLKVQQLVAIITPTQLKTLRGTNNIWSSANDNIEIKYFKH